MVVQTSQKIYTTATIAQIVEYVEKKSVKIAEEFSALQKKYVAEVNAFVEEISKLDAQEQIAMLTEKVQAFAAQYIEMMTPYYNDLQKFLEAYQVKVMEQYNKMSAKMVKQFQQMSEQAIAQYKTLSAMAVAKFEKFAAEMKAKYGKDFDKIS